MALSLNKQKEKEWNDIIKQTAKANGWKFRGWLAYKVVNDFFYEVSFFAAPKINTVDGRLSFKPLIIDEVFWEIVDLEDNKKMPQSFRGNGAFVVDSKVVFDYTLPINTETLKTDIGDLFNSINIKVVELSSTIADVLSFVQYVEQHPDKRNEAFNYDLLTVAFIVQKDYEKALALIDHSKKTRGLCRWGFGDKNFYDLAIEYCVARRDK